MLGATEAGGLEELTRPVILTAEEADTNLYGYVPMLAPCILFIVLFGIVTVVHLGQVCYHRQWWLIILPLGTLAELGGYIPRIISRDDTHRRDPYVATMTLLIVTPCLFAAVHFTVLGRIGTLFPRRYSLLPPVMIMPVFVAIDVISLCVQAGGAAAAGSSDSEAGAQSGAHVAVAGVAVQLLGYLIFMSIFITFWFRTARNPPEGYAHFRPLMIATLLSSWLIILRSIYRVAELASGWTGTVATKEWALYVFDATFVFVAVLILNIVHPGRYLPKKFSWKYNPDKDPDALLESRDAMTNFNPEKQLNDEMTASAGAMAGEVPLMGGGTATRQGHNACVANNGPRTLPTTGSQGVGLAGHPEVISVPPPAGTTKESGRSAF